MSLNYESHTIHARTSARTHRQLLSSSLLNASLTNTLTSHYSRVTHESLTSQALTRHSESLASHSRLLLTSYLRAMYSRMHATTHELLMSNYSRVTHEPLLTSNSHDCTSLSWGSYHGTLYFRMEQSECNSNTPLSQID